jgi:hypothetical protein
MTFNPPRSVVSGEPYIVRQVHDRHPERLDDFAGETTFVVDLDDEGYRVCGPGVPADESVRVFEKSDEGAGKDVRVWLVRPAEGGDSFTATPVAASMRG